MRANSTFVNKQSRYAFQYNLKFSYLFAYIYSVKDSHQNQAMFPPCGFRFLYNYFFEIPAFIYNEFIQTKAFYTSIYLHSAIASFSHLHKECWPIERLLTNRARDWPSFVSLTIAYTKAGALNITSNCEPIH